MSLFKTIVKRLNEDEIQSDAQSAVSADSMSLANKNTLTHGNIRDHLKAADEAEEEVETQTFGVETDTGEVVKVYVAVADADEFEKALGKKLGEEDDIENVLDELANKYDIVDVKWPEEEEPDESAFGADNAEIQYDIEQDKSEDETSKESEDKLDDAIDANGNGIPDSEEKDLETATMPVDDDKDSGEKKGWLLKQAKDDDTSDDDTNDEDSPDEEPKDETPKKGGLKKKKDDEEESDEEDTSDEPKVEDKPKKGGLSKKKKAEESFSAPLISSVISESTDNGVEFADRDMARLYHSTSNRQQRLIIELLAALGIPGDVLIQKQSSFKTALRSSANDVIENSHLRIWLKKFVDAAHHYFEPVEEDLRSELHDQISSKLGVLAYEVARELGVSDKIIQARSYSVKKGIRAAVKKIAKNSKAKIALLMIANALGVSSGTSHADLITATEQEELDNPKSIDLIEDDPAAEQNLEQKQWCGPSQFAQIVQKAVLALGLPVENLQYQNAALQRAINTKRQSIKEMSLTMSKLNQLIEALDSNTNEDFDDSEISKAELIAGRRNVSEEDDGPADLGEWAIGNVDGKVTMKAGEFHVDLEDDGEGNLENLMSAVADGNIFSIKSDGKRITFRPTNHGTNYVVKVAGNHTFPNGVKLSGKSVHKLLDAIGEVATA